MTEYLETTVDKFTFKVATDRYYTPQGVWAQEDGARVRVGASDFLQQSNGDIAFAEIEPAGERAVFGEQIALLETIKVDLELGSPVSGSLVEVNSEVEDDPYLINKDPYGDGWLALVEPHDWPADRARLLDPQAYFEHMQREAREAAGKA